jgi:hypothetical protein
VIASLLALAWQTPSLQAQWYPYWPDQGGFGPGNVLRGTATVMDAQGNLMLQQEQARIVREQALQSKLDTKRKTLDWLNYEREHTWTFTQEQQRVGDLRIQRLLQNAREGEIVSGSAMNTLLPFMQSLVVRGIHGPPVYLDPQMLKQINVTGAGTGNNAGVLRNGANLSWPIALRGPAQKTFEKQLSKAITDATQGNLELSQFRQLSKEVDAMQESAKKAWLGEQIDSAMYLDSKRFLSSLRDGMAVLTQPNAASYLTGGVAATGATVAELVSNMSQNGLRFGPATPGSEPAYFGLYNALVAFAAGNDSDNGFRVRSAPMPVADSSQRR